LFSYALLDPINKIDPEGKLSYPCKAAMVALAVATRIFGFASCIVLGFLSSGSMLAACTVITMYGLPFVVSIVVYFSCESDPQPPPEPPPGEEPPDDCIKLQCCTSKKYPA
jgi:hypothetical protein